MGLGFLILAEYTYLVHICETQVKTRCEIEICTWEFFNECVPEVKTFRNTLFATIAISWLIKVFLIFISYS